MPICTCSIATLSNWHIMLWHCFSHNYIVEWWLWCKFVLYIFNLKINIQLCWVIKKKHTDYIIMCCCWQDIASTISKFSQTAVLNSTFHILTNDKMSCKARSPIFPCFVYKIRISLQINCFLSYVMHTQCIRSKKNNCIISFWMKCSPSSVQCYL